MFVNTCYSRYRALQLKPLESPLPKLTKDRKLFNSLLLFFGEKYNEHHAKSGVQYAKCLHNLLTYHLESGQDVENDLVTLQQIVKSYGFTLKSEEANLQIQRNIAEATRRVRLAKDKALRQEEDLHDRFFEDENIDWNDL